MYNRTRSKNIACYLFIERSQTVNKLIQFAGNRSCHRIWESPLLQVSVSHLNIWLQLLYIHTQKCCTITISAFQCSSNNNHNKINILVGLAVQPGYRPLSVVPFLPPSQYVHSNKNICKHIAHQLWATCITLHETCDFNHRKKTRIFHTLRFVCIFCNHVMHPYDYRQQNSAMNYIQSSAEACLNVVRCPSSDSYRVMAPHICCATILFLFFFS